MRWRGMRRLRWRGMRRLRWRGMRGRARGIQRRMREVISIVLLHFPKHLHFFLPSIFFCNIILHLYKLSHYFFFSLLLTPLLYLHIAPSFLHFIPFSLLNCHQLGRNNLFPTLFLLWRCPHAIRSFVIHPPVSGTLIITLCMQLCNSLTCWLTGPSVGTLLSMMFAPVSGTIKAMLHLKLFHAIMCNRLIGWFLNLRCLCLDGVLLSSIVYHIILHNAIAW